MKHCIHYLAEAPLDLKLTTEIETTTEIKKLKATNYLQNQRSIDCEIKLRPCERIKIKKEYFQNITEDNHIFTDGSKIENRVGAAFVHHVNKQEITKSQYRLADHNTVYIESLSDNRELIWQIRKRMKDREGIKLMQVRAHKGENGE
ncbi:hypothetical protein AVEN_188019-1 [Araneus ventricosus]|uniref:RNase H type-1 domain-containing protein n=1 Tax=Araneus ventricosus TaxID=182803 RepID=A0A4Y1ZX52_ARAVE|nr:hypothetical protein AVEN_188019-1 [Araneus ventricosus]